MLALGAVTVILTAALIVQQVLHARERAILLDRIQAPEKAPFVKAKPQPVEPDETVKRNLELAMAPDA